MSNKSNVSTEQRSYIEREGSTGVYDFGQYYRYVRPNLELDKDFIENEIFIVTSMDIHHISKNVHSLTLLIPSFLMKSGRSSKRVSIKDIENCFVFVDTDTAEKERASKLREIECSVNAIQNDMQTALISPETIMSKIMVDENEKIKTAVAELDMSVPLLPPPAALVSGNAVSSVGGQQVEVLRKQLMNQQKLGNVISVYTKEKQVELVRLLNDTSDIQLEKAKAVQGQAYAMIETFDDVESKIEQVSLYLGESVKIITVCDKPVSDSREQFVFFSHMIYLDDEMLTHQLFTDSTFDQHSIDKFFDHLNDNPQFRDRILPTERCLIAVRPRRRNMEYTDCPFTNEVLNVGNFSSFLLVRDGERINAIYSAIDYQQRLFPTQAELEQHFTTITDANDVGLTDAQKKLDRLASMYLKVASILQGISDRQHNGGQIVFGDFVCERFAGSLFDPSAIEQNVRFINDEDFLLGNKSYLTAPQAWIKQHYNGEYRENDLIYIDGAVVNENNTPQAYVLSNDDFHSDPYSIWDLKDGEDEVLKLVRFNIKEQKHCIYISAINTQFNTKLYNTTRNMRVLLLSDTPDYLNIRYLKLSEMLDIMQSRVARPYINDYGLMPSLIKAQSVIEQLMKSYHEYIVQIQAVCPDVDKEDAYIAALNFVLSKDSAKYASPPVPKKGWIDSICLLLKQQTPLTDEHYTQAEAFALSCNETPICIAQLPLKSVLVTGHSLQKTSSMVESANQYIDNNILFDDLTLYQILPTGEIVLIEKLDYKQAVQLINSRYYPLIKSNESIKNPLVESGYETMTARQCYIFQNDMAHAYRTSISLINKLALVQELLLKEANQTEHAKIKYFVSSFKSAICSPDDDDKYRLVKALLSEITLPNYSKANNDEKRKTIAIARGQCIVGYGIQDDKSSLYFENKCIHAAMLLADYFAMIVLLLDAMPDRRTQHNLTLQFNSILVDDYFVNENHLASLKRKWGKANVIRGFEVGLPLSHDLYDVDLNMYMHGHGVADDELALWLNR